LLCSNIPSTKKLLADDIKALKESKTNFTLIAKQRGQGWYK